jgi:16S rRNA (adenine1518-N6/adenine1519-N6)-dimethyltransferase
MTRGPHHPRKRFGQHFLEPQWIGKVLAAIDPSPAEVFIEIGPGRGALTLPLAAKAGSVVAIEIDRDLSAALRSRQVPRLEIVTGDVLDIDLARLVANLPGGPVRIAGNLPYYISTPVLFRLLELARAAPRVRDAVLMLQDEVAARLTAVAGTRRYGVLAVLVRPSATVTPLLHLPPGAFRPAPRVASTLVHLEFHEPRLGAADPRLFEQVVRRLFQHRRKMLLPALRDLAAERGHDAGTLIGAAGLDPRQRPETLELADLTRLTELLAVLPAPPML